MSIGILLVTHPGIGEALLKNTCDLIGSCPLRTHCLDIPLQSNTEDLLQVASRAAQALDDGGGVLILTDAFGATPATLPASSRQKCARMWFPA